MIFRHDREIEQVKTHNSRKEEELLKIHNVETRALPKRIRNERKAREAMFRESIRISNQLLHNDQINEKMRKVSFLHKIVCPAFYLLRVLFGGCTINKYKPVLLLGSIHVLHYTVW